MKTKTFATYIIKPTHIDAKRKCRTYSNFLFLLKPHKTKLEICVSSRKTKRTQATAKL